jgi:hypothetical protein
MQVVRKSWLLATPSMMLLWFAIGMQSRRLGDLAPVVLNRSVPEPADERLISRSRSAVGDTERLRAPHSPASCTPLSR